MIQCLVPETSKHLGYNCCSPPPIRPINDVPSGLNPPHSAALSGQLIKRRVGKSGVSSEHALYPRTPYQPSSGNHGFTEHERPVSSQDRRQPDRPIGGGNARQPIGGDQEGIVADAESSRGSKGLVGKGRATESGRLAAARRK